MRLANRGAFLRVTGTAVLALWLCGPAAADASEGGTQPGGYAVWTPKQLRFTYQGFTSRYSCDGLRDKVKALLLKLGARKDLQVTETSCSGDPGRPNPFPGVTVKMHVLEPANGREYDPAAPPVPAHWRMIDVTRWDARNPLDAAGDCELIEQVKSRILPLFTTRNVDYTSNCIPFQLSVGGTRLKAEVLMADEQGAKPGARRRGGPAPGSH